MNPALDNNYQQASQPAQNGGNVLSSFLAFKKNLTGDPEQAVKNLLSSGQMTQEQFNRFSQMANQLKGILH